MTLRLADIIGDAAADLGGIRMTGPAEFASVVVDSITHDSRKVRPGAMFACIPGAAVDGHDFAAQAIGAGAVALLVERELALAQVVAVPQLVVPSVRRAIGPVAASIYGHPARHLQTIGVTGTNGKTTVTHMLREIWSAAGHSGAVIGTLTGVRTTPEASDLQASLAEAVSEHNEFAAIEVSSHGLDQHRVDGFRFDAAVFTNLSRDHLDYHGSMAAYFAAKAMLFEPERCCQAIVNLDDPHGRLLADAARVPTIGYSLNDVDRLELGADMSSFSWRGEQIRIHLGGRFNISNALAAATAASALGVADAAIVAGLGALTGVAGRWEHVPNSLGFTVIVDYAHTPDGLEQVLVAAREVVPAGKVIAVFGCGGDRDRSKRAPMGEIASRLADVAVLTSDNPRSEDPMAIIEDVRRGMLDAPAGHVSVIEPDRADAIRAAMVIAVAGDIVVVTGKGHERTQTIGAVVKAFDDRDVAQAIALELAR